MEDRAFWGVAIGVAPVLLLAITGAPVFADQPDVGFLGWAAVLLAEAAALWRLADRALAGHVARARRVAFGLVVSVVTAVVSGAAVLLAIVMIAFGSGG